MELINNREVIYRVTVPMTGTAGQGTVEAQRIPSLALLKFSQDCYYYHHEDSRRFLRSTRRCTAYTFEFSVALSLPRYYEIILTTNIPHPN